VRNGDPSGGTKLQDAYCEKPCEQSAFTAQIVEVPAGEPLTGRLRRHVTKTVEKGAAFSVTAQAVTSPARARARARYFAAGRALPVENRQDPVRLARQVGLHPGSTWTVKTTAPTAHGLRILDDQN